VQPPGTKQIMIVGCSWFIQLRNSSDLCTDQQSIVQNERCDCRGPKVSFFLSRYGTMISLTSDLIVACMDQYVPDFEGSNLNLSAAAS
jgi:hypothetical protein